VLLEFQRLYTPTAFRQERILWRAVIQLNVVRSIRTILEAISSTSVSTSTTTSPYSSPKLKSRVPRISQNSDSGRSKNGESSRAVENSLRGSGGGYGNDSDSERGGRRSNRSSTLLGVPSPLENLKNRLAPLRRVETLLIAKLVPPNEEEPTHLGRSSGSSGSPVSQTFPTRPHHLPRRPSQNGVLPRDQEFFVRASQGIKGVLTRARVANSSVSESDDSVSDRRATNLGNGDVETPDEVQEVLNACQDDMIQLWYDENVREILRTKKIRLEESSGL